MALPPLNIEAILLGSHVAKVLSEIHRVAYAQISPDLIILRASSNFSGALNEPDDQIIGQPLTKVIWEFIGVQDSLKAICDGALPYLAFERVQRQGADGQLYYLDLSLTPLRNPDLGDGLLLIVEDVTHTATLEHLLTQNHNELSLAQEALTKAHEHLQELNRLKSILISMAAHDIRNPLTAVKGHVDLIQKKLNQKALDRVQPQLTVITSQIRRLDHIISDFLDLDRINQGEIILKPAMCNLQEIIEEVMAVMQVKADRRQIITEIDLPDAPLQLWADQDKLHRIIYNLASNAIKYTPENGCIQIRARQMGEQIFLQVIDNGQGINPKQVSQLFRLYYRTSDAKQSQVRGAGVGLYIVKTLVEAHQGQIEVESEPGQGTTFTITLPVDPRA